MKYAIFFLCLYCLAIPSKAQLIDDFEDGDLNAAPAWQGMLSAFTTIDGTLRSQHTTANSVFYISTNLAIDSVFQFVLNCKLGFNTSSLNYVDLMLFSDSADLRKARNGLFVRLGGSNDEIALFLLRNGVESKLIDGKDARLNASTSHYEITVLYQHDTCILRHKKQGTTDLVEEGRAYYAQSLTEAYCGMRIRQSTASFFNRHFFDGLYMGMPVLDTLAPYCDSVVVTGKNRIHCFFSEPCDSLSLLDTAHYRLQNSFEKPIKVICSPDLRSAELEFGQPFEINRPDFLQIKQIRDLLQNKSETHSLAFLPYKPDTPARFDLLITELMVDPEPSAGLPEEEYIEIRNTTKHWLGLGDCRISDPTAAFNLPLTVIGPDSFLVLRKIPALNNASDHIMLKAPDGNLIHELRYTDRWYNDAIKQAGGYSLEMIDCKQPCMQADNWTASRSPFGGTPGLPNSVETVLPSDNTAPYIVSVTTEKDSLLHFVLSETADTSSVLLWSVDGNPLPLDLKTFDPDKVRYTFIWPLAHTPEQVFRVRLSGFGDCSGNIMGDTAFVLQWPALCREKDMVINEVLFNPVSGGKDFIELYNASSRVFDLSVLFLADLDAGGLLAHVYPISREYCLLQPGSYLLLSEDTAQICSHYKCTDRKAIKLQMPALPVMPDDAGGVVLLNLRNETVDSLRYNQDWHFTLLSDRNGVSLERLSAAMQTNDRNNWHSAAASVGFASPGAVNSGMVLPLKPKGVFSVISRTLSPDMDGFEDLMLLRYILPKPGFTATVRVYALNGLTVKTMVNAETLGSEGVLSWDGTNDGGTLMPPGIYVVLIECLHPDGTQIREKMSVVLASLF